MLFHFLITGDETSQRQIGAIGLTTAAAVVVVVDAVIVDAADAGTGAAVG